MPKSRAKKPITKVVLEDDESRYITYKKKPAPPISVPRTGPKLLTSLDEAVLTEPKATAGEARFSMQTTADGKETLVAEMPGAEKISLEFIAALEPFSARLWKFLEHLGFIPQTGNTPKMSIEYIDLDLTKERNRRIAKSIYFYFTAAKLYPGEVAEFFSH